MKNLMTDFEAKPTKPKPNAIKITKVPYFPALDSCAILKSIKSM